MQKNNGAITHEEAFKELYEAWPSLSPQQKLRRFKSISKNNHPLVEELFLSLDSKSQAEIVERLPLMERRAWLRLLPPDDVADVIQMLSQTERIQSLELLDGPAAREVQALLAYAEDEAGGLMNSQFFRIRPDMNADEAIHYLRMQAKHSHGSIYYAYVLDMEQKLLGILSFRELFIAQPDAMIQDIMRQKIIHVPENMDQEDVIRLISQHHIMALPVVDALGRMKGIVSANDIIDVVKEEATEDIQKIGGMQVMEEPYFSSNFLSMIKKRAGWLTVLFVGEMLTATAMAFYEKAIAQAVVLALFIPLIISSGGNSGSQASTLIIRSLALKEIRLKDWWRVLGREIAAGLSLGLILGVIGFSRILFWPTRNSTYGEHYMLIAGTIFCSLVGVVLWGVLSGAMLPFILKRIGFDPASASAPFVATIVDVTGLVIYFSIAHLFLKGVLL